MRGLWFWDEVYQVQEVYMRGLGSRTITSCWRIDAGD